MGFKQYRLWGKLRDNLGNLVTVSRKHDLYRKWISKWLILWLMKTLSYLVVIAFYNFLAESFVVFCPLSTFVHYQLLSTINCDTLYVYDVKLFFAMSSLGADHLLAIISWQIFIHQTFFVLHCIYLILSAAVTYCVLQEANKVYDISCNIFITLL